jgi:hypothetical protein
MPKAARIRRKLVEMRRQAMPRATGRARIAGQVNKQEDRHVEGAKRK